MKTSILAVCTILAAILSFRTSAQEFRRGCILDSVKYARVPIAAQLSRGDYGNIPTARSLKHRTPKVGHQGQQGSCTAWATAYAARTIAYADRKRLPAAQITRNAFSPSFVYNQIRLDSDCDGGTAIPDALDVLERQGVPLLTDFPYSCYRDVTNHDRALAASYKIKSYRRLFYPRDRNAALYVKKSIAEGRPVVGGFYVTSNFDYAEGVWRPAGGFDGGHAMAVIGYDDAKYGGAFEVMNSWGNDWGNGGFIWIRYSDFQRYCIEAYELIDYTDSPSPPVVPTPSPTPSPTPPQPKPVDPKPPITPVLETHMEVSLGLRTAEGLQMAIGAQGGRLSVERAYPSGTLFRVHVTNRKPAYVFVFGTDEAGKASRLFPLEGVSPWLDYSESTIILPDENHFIRLDQTTGEDRLVVLIAREPVDYSAVLNKVQGLRTTTELIDALKQSANASVLGDREITTETDGSLTVKASDPSIINGVVIISISHR